LNEKLCVISGLKHITFDETLIGKEFLISVNELRESSNAAIQITEEMIEDKNYE